MTSVLKLDMEMYYFVHLRFLQMLNTNFRPEMRVSKGVHTSLITFFMFLLRPTVVNWSPWQ